MSLWKTLCISVVTAVITSLVLNVGVAIGKKKQGNIMVERRENVYFGYVKQCHNHEYIIMDAVSFYGCIRLKIYLSDDDYDKALDIHHYAKLALVRANIPCKEINKNMEIDNVLEFREVDTSRKESEK